MSIEERIPAEDKTSVPPLAYENPCLLPLEQRKPFLAKNKLAEPLGKALSLPREADSVALTLRAPPHRMCGAGGPRPFRLISPP